MAEATQSRAQLNILVLLLLLLFCFLFKKATAGFVESKASPVGLDAWWLRARTSTWAGIPLAAGFCPLCPGVRPRLLAGWLSLSPELSFPDPSFLACSVRPPLP